MTGGDIQRIYDKIDEIKEFINKKHVDLIEKISNKPCETHRERIRGLKIQVSGLWVILGIITLGGIIGVIIKKVFA